MIQVVSAYLLIQRGEVTDDNPTHQKVEYIPKSRFKRWLLLDPLNYEKHLFVGFGGGRTELYQDYSIHSATVFYDKYQQRQNVSAEVRADTEYTTLDGESSLTELDYRTWGLIQKSEFSQLFIGSIGFSSDVPINNIQYYENRTPVQFPVHEFLDVDNFGGQNIPPGSHAEENTSHGGFAAEYYKKRHESGIWEGWWEAIDSARIVSGVPVFASYEDGMDYCDKVRAYRDNQSSANYQAACEAIDKCINPD